MGRRKQTPALPPMPAFTEEWTPEHAGWLVAARVRASNGDEHAAEALSEAVRRQPAILDAFLGMAATAEAAWIAAIAPQDVEQRWEREVLAAEAERLRASLLGQAPTPVERLLVDRIVACQLAAMWAESTLATRLASGGALPLMTFYAEQADRQHRRLLKATEALARVRRLMAPTQINVALGGGQQVNVGRLQVGSGRALPEAEAGVVIEAEHAAIPRG